GDNKIKNIMNMLIFTYDHFSFAGSLYSTSQAWHVRMPRNIEALYGSCLTIPCSFDYYRYPPKRPDRVVWYQYQSMGYPLVYDNWYPNDVISIYKERTQALTSTYGKTCTLHIKTVNWNDHRQVLFPWVDPENVGRSTHAFYETTVTIEVCISMLLNMFSWFYISSVAQPEAPTIMITGFPSTVRCTASYTCSNNRPSLTWNYANMPVSSNTVKESGKTMWTTVSTLTFTPSAKDHGHHLTCFARFDGGQTQEKITTGLFSMRFIRLIIRNCFPTVLKELPEVVIKIKKKTLKEKPQIIITRCRFPFKVIFIPARSLFQSLIS
uniref:Ig-like domain-containing protein n=1 Tax=Fundulus heteroclitus TaxID=8078 RepID=A0A3Q2UNM5_FUNHE